MEFIEIRDSENSANLIESGDAIVQNLPMEVLHNKSPEESEHKYDRLEPKVPKMRPTLPRVKKMPYVMDS